MKRICLRQPQIMPCLISWRVGAVITGVLVLAAGCVRVRTLGLTTSPGAMQEFEEAPFPVVIVLGVR